MTAKDREIIADFRRRIPSDTAKHVKRIIVFGSRARGNAHDDSDLDILVLVDERTYKIERSLDDIAYAVMWDNDFKPIISLKVFSDLHYHNAVTKGFSFYKYIDQEGIVL